MERGSGDVAEGEVFFDGQRIKIAGEAAMRQQRFEFGAEKKGAVWQQGVEKRLDAKSVARQEQGFTIPVPQGKGEHATKTFDAFLSPGFPGVDDDLRVASGVKHVSEGE